MTLGNVCTQVCSGLLPPASIAAIGLGMAFGASWFLELEHDKI